MRLTVRAPARISLGGGGTDLPEYYEQSGSYFIAAAIDRYVHLHVRDKRGHADLDDDNFVVQAFRSLVPEASELRIATSTEVPPGSGLGSSGALAVALVVAAEAIEGISNTAQDRASIAYSIEREFLTQHAGRQDTLVAVFGGLREYSLSAISCESAVLPISSHVRAQLTSNLLLVDTGIRRRANSILAEQAAKLAEPSLGMRRNLDQIKAMATQVREMLCAGDLDGYASLMHEHWMLKRDRAAGISTPEIDFLYDFGLRNGASGGKLVGAGGGGFLLLYSTEPERVLAAYSAVGRQAKAVGLCESGVAAEW